MKKFLKNFINFIYPIIENFKFRIVDKIGPPGPNFSKIFEKIGPPGGGPIFITTYTSILCVVLSKAFDKVNRNILELIIGKSFEFKPKKY